MSQRSNLDDMNQSVAYIPYNPSADENEQYSPFQDRDLPDGPVLRFEAYKIAWSRCLDRVKSIIDAIHTPVIDEIVDRVNAAYTDILPGLPYPELPVISIAGADTSLFEKVVIRLEQDDNSAHHVVHLRPPECTTVMTGMKALIGGFIALNDDVKRKPSTSVANYDITLLKAWYDAHVHDENDRLVVFLHDFEQFDRPVIQDILYICSQNVKALPFLFILSLSSPSFPSYLHTAYPRSTLALLRVSIHAVVRGEDLLQEVVRKTFFDLEFEPSIILGPTALNFLEDYCNRHDNSTDSLITILHLAHLKHFDEPLTALVPDSHLGTQSLAATIDKIQEPSSFPFLDALLTRIHSPESDPDPEHAKKWQEESISSLLLTVDSSRVEFYTSARRMRVAVALMECIKTFMRAQGYKSMENMDGSNDVLGMFSAAVRGRLGRDVKWLGMMVKKLSDVKMDALLSDIRAFFHELPESIRQVETDVTAKVSGFTAEDGEEVAVWLTSYLQNALTDLGDSPAALCDVWYTGLTPFPSELINPSVRASVISGLLYPYEYTDQAGKGKALWEMPDTGILFRRYLDSGRMINVYDWFESFAIVLEEQKRRFQPEGEDGEEAEEQWKIQVQARFIRALHELDHLGFIKHTGRKAGHVMKTVFELPD